MPARSAGSATIHTKGVVHGVTALKRGTRYGLFLCELPDENVDLLYLTDVAAEQLRFFGPAMGYLDDATELQRTEATSVKLLTAELENYRAYLLQAAGAETELPVPSLIVDLLWHSHMLFPSRYASECMRIAGVLINHDDDL